METKGGFYITQIKHLQERIFDKLLIEYGLDISGGQGRILFVLWKKDRPMTINEISKETSLAKNTTSIICEGMVTKGMIRKREDDQDRRRIFVEFTDKMYEMKNKYEEVSNIMGKLFYKDFPLQDQVIFESYLQKILITLQELDHYTASELVDLEEKLH